MLPSPYEESYHLTEGTKASAVGRLPGVVDTDEKSDLIWSSAWNQHLWDSTAGRVFLAGASGGLPGEGRASGSHTAPKVLPESHPQGGLMPEPAGCHGNLMIIKNLSVFRTYAQTKLN